MKTFYNVSIILILTFAQISFGQTSGTTPVPPEPPKFDFEFQDFNNMSEHEEKQLLKNIKEDLQKELKFIKNFKKDKYFDFLRESQFKNLEIPFMVKREKEQYEREKKIFELEIKTEALASKYEAANRTEKEKIKNELRQKIGDLFIEKEEERKSHVAELEKELSELKKSLEVRMKSKNEIISRRVQELINEDRYLDWD